MTEFGAAATLEITEVNGAQAAIEQEVSVPMGASPAPSQRQRSSGGAVGGGSLPSLAKDRNAILADILNELEQMGGGLFGGGGGDDDIVRDTVSSGGGGLLSGALAGGGVASSLSSGAALAGGAVAGFGAGVAGVRGLDEVGAIDAVRGAGQRVGNGTSQSDLRGLNQASDGELGSLTQAGGSILSLARGNGLNGPAAQQASSRFQSATDIQTGALDVSSARGSQVSGPSGQGAAPSVTKPDWLSGDLDVSWPDPPDPLEGASWPDVPDPFSGVDWPELPSLSNNLDWPELPSLSNNLDWPEIPTPSQSDLPTLPVPDAGDLPTLEVNVPDELQGLSSGLSSAGDSTVESGSSVLDADGDGDVDADDLEAAFRSTFGGG